MFDDAKNFMSGKIGLDVDRMSWRSEEQVTVADVSEVSTSIKCSIKNTKLVLGG